MKRRLIKQGKGGFTVTVPIKFVREFNLKAGDELQFDLEHNKLMVTPEDLDLPKKEITITSAKSVESSIRTLLANAYRAGFDRINLTYKGDEQILLDLVKEQLLGFEIFKKKEHLFVIESVAEPNYDDFENIFKRQFYMILEIIRNIEDPSLKNNANIIQRYDNFLKRCISKKFFSPDAGLFFWQLISNLTQISRQCYYLNKNLLKNKMKLSDKEKEYLKEVEEMFIILQKSYLSKDLTLLDKIHQSQKNLFYEHGPKLLEKNLNAHYLMYLARLVYLANSPLTGCLQLSSHK